MRLNPLPGAKGDKRIAEVIDGRTQRLRVGIARIERKKLRRTLLEETACHPLPLIYCHAAHGHEAALIAIPSGQQRHMSLTPGGVARYNVLGQRNSIHVRPESGHAAALGALQHLLCRQSPQLGQRLDPQRGYPLVVLLDAIGQRLLAQNALAQCAAALSNPFLEESAGRR